MASRRERCRSFATPAIEDVPIGAWSQLAKAGAVSLEAPHLRAVEASRINDLHPYYIVGFRGGRVVGIAYCFAMDIDLTKLASGDPPEVLATVKAWRPGFMRLRVLEVGHLASLGATIEAVPGDEGQDFLRALASELEDIGRLENADIGLIRDLPIRRYAEFRVFEDDGYRPALGFPIARLALRWPTLDGYLAALKHKKRKNWRHIRTAIEVPEMSVEVIDDYGRHAERLAELWSQVASRHGEYEHERLTPAYFTALARYLPGRSHIVALKLGREIVAFGLGLIGDQEYIGVAEGIDYTYRDRYALYPNLVLQVIAVACRLGMKSLNLGITTYDFKASLGAELEPVVYLVKAFKNPQYSAAYAELLRTGIRQPQNHHRPFAASAPEHGQPADARKVLTRHDDPRDPFARALGYLRADVSRAVGLYPYCPVFSSAQEPIVRHEGREVIMMGTNSYLGLGTDPRVKAAARDAIDTYGTGCSGSPHAQRHPRPARATGSPTRGFHLQGGRPAVFHRLPDEPRRRLGIGARR